MAAVPPLCALLRAKRPKKILGRPWSAGRSPPASEEWLAAKPQDIKAAQCERSNSKSFAKNILLCAGERVWGAEYRSPKSARQRRRAGVSLPEGALRGGAKRPRARRAVFCCFPNARRPAAGLSHRNSRSVYPAATDSTSATPCRESLRAWLRSTDACSHCTMCNGNASIASPGTVSRRCRDKSQPGNLPGC